MHDRLRARIPWHAVPLLLPAPPFTGRVLGEGPMSETWQSCLDSWDLEAPPTGRGGLVMTDAAQAALRAVMDEGADDVLLAGPDKGRLLERAGLSTWDWVAVVADAGAVAMVPAGRAGLRPAPAPGRRGAVVDTARRGVPPARVTVATRRGTGPPALLAAVAAPTGYLLAGGGGPRRRPVLFGGQSGHAPTTVVKATPASAPDAERRARSEQDVLARLLDEGLGGHVPAPMGAGRLGPFRWSAESARPGRPLAHLLGRTAAAPKCLAVLDEVAAWLGRLGERTRVPIAWPARQQAPLLLGEHAQLKVHLSGLEGVPAVLVHGDLGAAHNLLVDGVRWTAIDWETANWQGLPMTDLLPLLCGALASLRVHPDPRRQAAYVLQLCRGDAADSPWLHRIILRYLTELHLPLSSAGSLAAIAFGHQASMRLAHHEAVRLSGQVAPSWTSPWDEVARQWDRTPGLGAAWSALAARS